MRFQGFQDIFKPIDEKLAERELRESEKNLAVVGDLARICLETEQFKKYREHYIRVEKNLIDDMLNYTRIYFKENNGDLTKYAVMMARYMTRLEDIRSLLTSVEKDALRGKKRWIKLNIKKL